MAALAPAAATQEVHGSALVAGTNAGSSETTVVLVDSAGSVVARMLTDASGHFVLRTQRSGTYRVRTRRIGFMPDSSPPVALAPGHVATVDFSMRAFATRLPAVTVQETRRCVMEPEAGAVAFRLWQEAQSALTATALTSESGEIGFVLRRFERELDPETSQVRRSQSWDSHATTSEPYASIPADSLAVHGFVVPAGKMLVYYAPDAHTLTSDAFVRTHCFRPTEDKAHPGSVGLAFEPARVLQHAVRHAGAAPVRDVSGVLWFDRASMALQYLTFTYGAPAGSAAPVSTPASGRVDYQRFPTGGWIVSHWRIRMPVVSYSTTLGASPGVTFEPGAILSRREIAEIVAIWEAGGDVLSVVPPTPASGAIASAFGAVRGTFIDTSATSRDRRGTHAGGVARLRVMLSPAEDSGAIYSAETDSAGEFSVDSIRPGNYTVTVGSPWLDTLGIEIAERDVHVAPGTQQSLLTVVPSAAAAVHGMCPSGLSGSEALVHGIVRDAAGGQPIAHARVVAKWFNVADARQKHFVAATGTLATTTDGGGEYVICGISSDRVLTITAATDTRKSSVLSLAASTARVRLANLTVGATTAGVVGIVATGGNQIVGTVHDTSGRPVLGAAVRLDSTVWMPVTNTGNFAFRSVTPGRHVLEARALGYDLHAWYVRVTADRPAIVGLALQRAIILNGVQVVGRRDTSVLDPTGFSERRRNNAGGYFLGTAQIAARAPQRTTDLLRALPGVELHPVGNVLGSHDNVLVMRGTTTVRSEVCPIQFYIDGHPFAASDDIDRMLSPRDISGIEVYPGASQVPPRFKGATARCGVIAVWTRDSGAGD